MLEIVNYFFRVGGGLGVCPSWGGDIYDKEGNE